MSSLNSEVEMKNAGGEAVLFPASPLNQQLKTREVKSMSSTTQNKNIGARLDKLFHYTTMFFAFLVFILLFGIIVTLFMGSLPALKTFGPAFFTSSAWNPVDIQFGGLVPIYGTFITALIAMLIGIPVSF